MLSMTRFRKRRIPEGMSVFKSFSIFSRNDCQEWMADFTASISKRVIIHQRVAGIRETWKIILSKEFKNSLIIPGRIIDPIIGKGPF